MSIKLVKTLLIIEDNPGDARLLREMLSGDSKRHTELIYAESMSQAETHLSGNGVDLILLDLGLPDAQGLAAIRRTRAAAPSVPLVVLTGMDDEELATQSLQEGAQDYLIKGQIESRTLLRALRYAAERKRLERLKDEFVSTVSHELRTPLTSISASLGLLMTEAAGILPRAAARLLEIAHNNSERLVRLVNDILDIEKPEAGRVAFDLRRINVRPLVEQVVEAIGGFALANGVGLRIEAATTAVADVRADPDRLAQVISNLLSNAVKFSPRDDEVVIKIEQGIDLVRISVRDHGSGIPADFKSRIFERFAQADATNTRQRGGTGLGLSIVKQIVDRLAGEVGFADAPEGGTIFFVELPRWGGKADMDRDQRSNTILSESDTTLITLEEAARECLTLSPSIGVKEVS
jgi:signal transduction histidine kinase